jgi:hypothetical protein
MRWAGHVAFMWERRVAYSVLVGKPEGNRPLGRQMRSSGDNINMVLKKVKRGEGGHGLDRAGQEWRRVAACYKRGNELPGSIKCGEFPD